MSSYSSPGSISFAHLVLVFLLCSVLSFPSCHGQGNTDPQGTTSLKEGQSKLVKNHFFPEVPDENLFVQCGLEDRQGNLWIGTAGNGIYRFDGKDFLNFTHRSFNHFSLKDDLNHDDILCCAEDRSGNIWFGTRRGVIQYHPTGNTPVAKDFNLWLIPENIPDPSTGIRMAYVMKPNENFVWSIMQDQMGTLWFGTSTGVYTCDLPADSDDKGPLFSPFLAKVASINKEHLQMPDISTMHQDRHGTYWFASAWNKGEGIIRYDGTSLIRFMPDSLRSFRAIIERKNGDLLFLSPFDGVYSYDGSLFSNALKKMGIAQDTLVSMIEDHAGNLWLGHSSGKMSGDVDGGLLRYDGENITIFTTKDGLSHNHVFCMIETRDGNLWFGTRNTGLCRYDGKRYIKYTD